MTKILKKEMTESTEKLLSGLKELTKLLYLLFLKYLPNITIIKKESLSIKLDIILFSNYSFHHHSSFNE